jgi:hypothetical protein
MAKKTKLTPSLGKIDASVQRMHVGPHARAIVAAFLILTSAEALAAPRMIGLGNQTCATWTAQPPVEGVGLLYQQWVLGFLSGVSYADPPNDPLSNIDPGDITLWLNKYCQDNSTVRLVDAAIAFIRAHHP